MQISNPFMLLEGEYRVPFLSRFQCRFGFSLRVECWKAKNGQKLGYTHVTVKTSKTELLVFLLSPHYVHLFYRKPICYYVPVDTTFSANTTGSICCVIVGGCRRHRAGAGVNGTDNGWGPSMLSERVW